MAGSSGIYRVSPRVTPLVWKGMTKDNHLRHFNELFEKDAQNASNHIVRLFSCQRGTPSFETLLNDAGIVEFENNQDIRTNNLTNTIMQRNYNCSIPQRMPKLFGSSDLGETYHYGHSINSPHVNGLLYNEPPIKCNQEQAERYIVYDDTQRRIRLRR